jgi:hypothetical protein
MMSPVIIGGGGYVNESMRQPVDSPVQAVTIDHDTMLNTTPC